jgi:hypothetical protein
MPRTVAVILMYHCHKEKKSEHHQKLRVYRENILKSDPYNATGCCNVVLLKSLAQNFNKVCEMIYGFNAGVYL